MSGTLQEVRRGKCGKKYTVKGYSSERYIVRTQWDGCNQFVVATTSEQKEDDENEDDDDEMRQAPNENCMACGCHWSFHEKKPERDNVVLHVQEYYTECCKNQILKQFFANESHVNDGCKEFVPGGPGFELICAGCSCHRSFHTREEISEE